MNKWFSVGLVLFFICPIGGGAQSDRSDSTTGGSVSPVQPPISVSEETNGAQFELSSTISDTALRNDSTIDSNVVSFLQQSLSALQQDTPVELSGFNGSAEPPENPFLFVIKGDPPSFIFGTIRVNDPSVARLSDLVKRALLSSHRVYTEINLDPLDRLDSFESTAESTTDRLTVKQAPQRLASRLKDQLSSSALGGYFWQSLRTQSIVEVAYQLPGLLNKSRGVPPIRQTVRLYATNRGNYEGGLRQSRVGSKLSELSDQQSVRWLRALLTQYESDRPFGAIRTPYHNGKFDATIDAIQSHPQPGVIPYPYQSRFIADDNRLFARTIIRQINQSDQSQFYAIGMDHFVGKNGVLEKLRRKGLTVKRLYPTERTKMLLNQLYHRSGTDPAPEKTTCRVDHRMAKSRLPIIIQMAGFCEQQTGKGCRSLSSGAYDELLPGEVTDQGSPYTLRYDSGDPRYAIYEGGSCEQNPPITYDAQTNEFTQ